MCSRFSRVALALGLSVLAGHAPGARVRAAQSVMGPLKIVVIEGEGAVNIIQQRTAVAPVVEVRDRNDQPVAGVLVTFSFRSGQRATFNGGLRAATVTTDAAGRATTTITPTANGAVQIDVSASFRGQTATATIGQTNVTTAAAAAGAAAAGGAAVAGGGAGATAGAAAGAGAASAGGGLSGAAIGGLVAGGIGGGIAASKVLGGNDSESAATGRTVSIASVFATPNSGLQGASMINFSAQPNDVNAASLTFTWDFGDGATGSGASTTHLYTAAGTFTVRVTATDGRSSASSQVAVTIKNLTGRWTLGTTTNFYDLVQTGSSISGAFVGAGGTQVRQLVSGLVQSSAPNVTFTDSSGIVFTGNASSADQVSGVFNGGGFPANTIAGITRQ